MQNLTQKYSTRTLRYSTNLSCIADLVTDNQIECLFLEHSLENIQGGFLTGQKDVKKFKKVENMKIKDVKKSPLLELPRGQSEPQAPRPGQIISQPRLQMMFHIILNEYDVFK